MNKPGDLSENADNAACFSTSISSTVVQTKDWIGKARLCLEKMISLEYHSQECANLFPL